jgi:N6-adenosine-specific RNA methylase IME4
MSEVTRVEDDANWYEILVADVRKMAFAGIVATKHAIGKRILAEELLFDKPEYGSRTMARLAKDTGANLSDIYNCVRFAREIPELSTAVENLSWNEIRHRMLPSISPSPPAMGLSEGDGCTVNDLQTLIDEGKTFGTIYADPPWKYGNQGTRGSTDNHYKTMTPDEIAALPIAKLAAGDAHLHLWTTNAFLFDAKAVIEAWGFEYKSCMVWVKSQMGMGNYWRVSHEFLLLGKRGQCKFAVRNQMSWQEHKRMKHSAKPPEFRETIELVSPSPRIELFGREAVDGWTVWGDEIARNLFAAE